MPNIRSSADLRCELYGLLQEGMDDLAAGKTRPFSEAMAEIRSRRKR